MSYPWEARSAIWNSTRLLYRLIGGGVMMEWSTAQIRSSFRLTRRSFAINKAYHCIGALHGHNM